MEDSQILSLYFARSEQAIAETDRKYGGYCYHIAYNILTNSQDAEESVSDTYLAAWNAIPPKRPAALAAFLGKITRFLSISRWRKRGAEKRGGGEFPPWLWTNCKTASAESLLPSSITFPRKLSPR